MRNFRSWLFIDSPAARSAAGMGSSDACDTFRRTATLAATGVGYVGANHGGAAHHSGILASRGVAKRRAICPEKCSQSVRRTTLAITQLYLCCQF